MRKMGPLKEDHPLVTAQDKCAACLIEFKASDLVTLIPLGPGNDSEGRTACRAGRAYNAVAAVVHWACATGEET